MPILTLRGEFRLMFCQEFFDGLKTLKKTTLTSSQLGLTRQILVDRLLGAAESRSTIVHLSQEAIEVIVVHKPKN